jgi:D-alanyl-D-alanine carboxypeptidase
MWLTRNHANPPISENPIFNPARGGQFPPAATHRLASCEHATVEASNSQKAAPMAADDGSVADSRHWRPPVAVLAARARPISICVTAGALMVAGCGHSTSTPSSRHSPDAHRSSVSIIADQLANAGVSSAIVAVSEHGHSTVATIGSPRPAADRRFRIGSVTKVFTATLILQLVDKRKLALNDTVERYLPGIVRAGRQITVRDLLNHRSGLANYTDDPTWPRRERRLTRPIQSLRFAASQPLDFKPGRKWGYSNTNYIALGLIIENITGHTYAHELDQRILKPLALRDTQLATTYRLPDLQDDGTNPNAPWAAGSIISNARDLSRFLSALLSGQLVSNTALQQMKQTVPVPPLGADGLGIFPTATSCGTAWGHNGQILDYFTLAAATPDGRRVAIVSARPAINLQPSDLDNDISTLLCTRDAATG